MSITPYATMADVKAMMKTERTTPEQIILGAIRQLSQRIDRIFYKRNAPFFAPVIETRSNYRLSGNRVNSYEGTFYIGEPLLKLTGVIVGTQSLTVGTDVQLYQSEYEPFDTIQLTDRCCNGWYRYVRCVGCQQLPYVTVSGIWGYNVSWINDSDPANNPAFQYTGQTCPVLTDTQTSFVVSDVDGANEFGITPAMSAGNLLQVNDEFMLVISTDTVTNTVTVIRGVNGSTATAHNALTRIYSYQVEEGIRRAVARQVAGQIAKLGAYDNITVADLADADFAVDLLGEIKALLSIYTNS